MAIISELPADFTDLLFVTAPDERSIKGMLTINQASGDWLMGRIDTGTYFDILDEYGVDPFDHIEPVEELVFGNKLSPLLLP